MGSFFSAVGCGDDTTETTAGTSNPTSTGTGTDTSTGTGTGTSTGTGTGTSTGTGTGGAGGGTADTLDCDTYCGKVMASCTTANAQYSDMASCMGSCKGLPEGTLADTMNNTLGCRIYHAGVAATMPDMHCSHAGPGGGDACGKNCEGFCAIAMSACTAANGGYADEGACMTECMGFKDTEPYDASDAAGDTLACRLYHLTVAASSEANAMMHCAHIRKDSPPCK